VTGIELTAVLVVSTVLVGYASYVGALVIQADFYTRWQKFVQCLLILLVPLSGTVIVHWFFRLHHAQPERPDRAFIPQREPGPEEVPLRRPHIDET
jgi:purine-cytosine permease-like protein